MLSSTNEYDRAGAVQGLGWMGDKENAKAVAPLLKDKDELVREAAKQSLEMMGASDLIKDKK
jgi:HEAT repeat protein